MIQGEKIVASEVERSEAATLDESSFWAVWREGPELPRIYTRKSLAVNEGRRRAAAAPGVTFWLMKVEPRGAIHFPDAPIVAGEFTDGPPALSRGAVRAEVVESPPETAPSPEDLALRLWWP